MCLLVWWNELDVRTLVARLAQQRFQSIAIALNDGVICADGNGVVTFWNNGAQSIFGFTPKEAVGLPLAVFYRADDDKPFIFPVPDQITKDSYV